MALTFRAASAADLPSVVELLERRDSRRYHPDDVAAYVQHFEANRAIGSLCFDDARAVGMSMVYRRRVVANGKTFAAGYWGNLFVLPEYKKKLVYPRLPLHMFRAAQAAGLDFVWTCSRRSESSSVHLSLGCAPLGELAVLAKPLRPAALLWRRRELPPGLSFVAKVPDAAFRTLNRVYTAPSRLCAGVETMASTSPEFSALAQLRQANGDLTHDSWDAEGLRARLASTLESDRYQIVIARRAGRIVGSVVFRIAERQGFRVGVLMDLQSLHGHEWALRCALVEVERRLLRAGAEVLLHLDGLHGRVRSLLKWLGYVPSPETYSMLVWPASFVADHEALRAERWSFSFIDHDAF